MKKIINKGYTLKVVSWENDGDNYNTKQVTYDNKELAIEVARMCTTLFISCHNGNNGIGNTNEGDEKGAQEKVLKYMQEHPILWENDEVIDDDLVGYCMEVYNYELLDGSEWYYSRICESVTLTYSKEDIYLEEIEF